MEGKQSEKISMPDVNAFSREGSTKSLVSNEKKKFSKDLWWKIAITIAVIVIAGYNIYKAVDDSKKSSTKTSLSASTNGQTSNVDENMNDELEIKSTAESYLDCTSGSIVDSQAKFTFQPHNSDKAYTTHGLEFSFEDIKRKARVEDEITKLPGAHYYYNIARCRIGGGVQLDKEPVIRGPIVFAIDEQCTKAYYFSKGWKEYKSARNLNCSAHGKEIVKVEESECLKGSIKNSNSSFVYVPFGSMKPYTTHGLEFSFEDIKRKPGVEDEITKLPGAHYYYNIARCRIGGGVQLDKEPVIRGPLVFAVDKECTKAYYFSKGWEEYISTRNLSCSAHGRGIVEESKCLEGSIKNSTSSFVYVPFKSIKPYTTHGLEFSFEYIKRKPGVEDEITKLPGAHYYYNIARCRIGGGVQLDKEPVIRGPIVFAIDEQCTKAYYFSKGWKEYKSARNLNCSAHGKEIVKVEESECLKGSIKNSNSSFVYVPFGSMKPYLVNGAEFSFEMIAVKSKLGSALTRLNKLIASTSRVHYYYNIPRCKIGGGSQLDKEPIIRGPIVFAVDKQCSRAYYFREGTGWIRYNSTRNFTCHNQANGCFEGSVKDSYSTFQYSKSSTEVVNATGIQYNFTNLVEKLRDLNTDFNVTRTPELSGQDVSYYLNLHRCFNGGPHDFHVTPQIRGPIIFAVSDNCSRVYFLSAKSSYQWKQYASGRNIKCTNRQV